MRKVFASTPVLVVADVRRSADFYERVLGYQCPAFFGDDFAMLHRNGMDLMLSRARRPEDLHPHGPYGVWDFHLRVADLAAEQAAIEAAGGKVREARTTEYGMLEIEVLDPDGHCICLGQDLEPRPEDRDR